MYNGNIAAMSVNIPVLGGGAKVYNYKYDQLNRIVSMDLFDGLAIGNTNYTLTQQEAYKERVSYDPNGNILTYLRNGAPGATTMDNMTYSYTAGTNKLHKVVDAATNNAAYSDIKTGQNDNNYQYDAIGNLIVDGSESITNISWNVYGKISTITKSGATISYKYDASGNRILKMTATDTTAYVRDASGNVMAVYVRTVGADTTLKLMETHLYGSSRLGMVTRHNDIDSVVKVNSNEFGNFIKRYFTRGEKLFELSNHLGNVLVTITDRRQQVSAGGSTVDSYLADINSASDYYPGGMELSGRIYTATNQYKYSYQGSEKDKELNTNTYTTFFREVDTRIGRWWSVDPKTNFSESPYVVMNNNSMQYNDVLGNTAQPVIDDKNKTISLNANIYISGKISKKQLNQIWKEATKAFNEELNSKTFKAKYKGEEYTVNFNVKVFTISEAEADKMASENQSIANNFITVFDSQRTSYSSIGKNVGAWTTGDFFGKAANPTTVVHEFFHSLGLIHPRYDNGILNSGITTNPITGLSAFGIPSWTSALSTPRISAPRGTYYLAPPANYVELNPRPVIKQITGFERSVKQIDINDAVRLMEAKPYKIHNSTIKTYDSNALFLQYSY